MKRLILFRHARTEHQAASGVDFDRRLTERGRLQAAEMALRLRDAGVSPDAVLISPATRAQETWAAVRDCFPDAAAHLRPLLYAADAEDILADAEAAGADSVMVIAHNPALQMLAESLLSQTSGAGRPAALPDGFSTAAVAVFDFPGNGNGVEGAAAAGVRLHALMEPKDGGP